MRRTWPYVAVVAVVGALAGGAIAGRPGSKDPFTLADVPVSTTTSTTLAGGPTVTTLPSETSTTASAIAVEPTGPDTVVDVTTTTEVVPPASVETTTTLQLIAGPTPRADVRLVVANGDGRFNLAGSNANRLRAAGYVTIDLTDVGDRVPTTVVYYRPGFDDEAATAASDLSVPNALLRPLPDTAVTSDDDLGDLIIVLGPDAPR